MESVPSRGGRRDVVVIGASAGGVETLKRVVAQLPSDLPASVCVVLHIAPDSPSALPRILERAGTLPCRAAQDGEELRRGEILVAPPDRHLVIEGRRVRLTVGPRENGHRPAVDALFRSAADAHADRVIGVILSGTRDDGAAGLAVIKARGGGTIVQDPEEAMYAGMPQSALATVKVDVVVPSTQIAEAVVAMVNGQDPPAGAGAGTDVPQEGSGSLPIDEPGSEPIPAPPAVAGGSAEIEPVTTICPECGGVLSEHEEAGVTQWRCRVGHRYSPDSLLDAQAHDVEAALWAAVRALEDRRILLERMATQFDSRDQRISARSVRRRASEAQRQAQAVREALASAAVTSLRQVSASPPHGLEMIDEPEEGLAS